MSFFVRVAAVISAATLVGVLSGCGSKPGNGGGDSGGGNQGDLPPREPKVVGPVPQLTPKTPGGAGPGPAPGPKEAPKDTGADKAKEDALARLRVVNDFQMMALSLQSFEEANGTFPPADGAEVEQKGILAPPAAGLKLPAGFSWRAQLLHHYQGHAASRDLFFALCQDKYPLAADAKPGENWNRAELKNKPYDGLMREKPEYASGKTWDTPYRVFVGGGAAFEPGKRFSRKDFTDGTSNTILVVEAGESVPWPKPDELAYDPAKPLPKLGGTFPDGFYAAFADGTVRFITNGTDEKALRAMITRAGAEVIAEMPPKVDTAALRKAAGLKD